MPPQPFTTYVGTSPRAHRSRLTEHRMGADATPDVRLARLDLLPSEATQEHGRAVHGLDNALDRGS